VGGEHPAIDPEIDPKADPKADPLVSGLRALGHTVSTAAQSSGVATIVRLPNASEPSTPANPKRSVYVGGVDPRREGVALGGQPRLDQ